MKKAIRILEHIFAIIGVLVILGIAAYCIFTGTPIFSTQKTIGDTTEKDTNPEKISEQPSISPKNTKKEITEFTYENITDDPYRGKNGSILRIETTDNYEITYRKFETGKGKQGRSCYMEYYTKEPVKFHTSPDLESDVVFECKTTTWWKLKESSAPADQEFYETYFNNGKSKEFKITEMACKKYSGGKIETWLKGSVEAFSVENAWLQIRDEDYYAKDYGKIIEEVNSKGKKFETTSFVPRGSHLDGKAKIYKDPGIFEGNEIVFDVATIGKDISILAIKETVNTLSIIDPNEKKGEGLWVYCKAYTSEDTEVEGWVQRTDLFVEGIGGGLYDTPEDRVWLNFNEL